MTRSLVLDASFTLKAVLDNPIRAQASQALAGFKREGLHLCAPTLWYYETTSAMSKLVHFGQLEPKEAAEALDLLMGLSISLIHPHEIGWERPLHWTARLGRAAAYDSFYLALAEHRGLQMWTADQKLHRAVAQPWVHVVGV